jgi:hypothetical protein
MLDVFLSGAMHTCLPVAAILATQKTPFVFRTGMRGEDVHTNRFPLAPVVEKPYQPPATDGRDITDAADGVVVIAGARPGYPD